MEFPEVPAGVLDQIRRVALALPEAWEGPAYAGTQFKVRRRLFAHVLTVTDPAGAPVTMLVCRADPDEREVVLAIGHPFFRPGSGADRIGMVIDAATDWTEVAELVTESYRLNAPKALAALVDGPPR